MIRWLLSLFFEWLAKKLARRKPETPRFLVNTADRYVRELPHSDLARLDIILGSALHTSNTWLGKECDFTVRH